MCMCAAGEGGGGGGGRGQRVREREEDGEGGGGREEPAVIDSSHNLIIQSRSHGKQLELMVQNARACVQLVLVT